MSTSEPPNEFTSKEVREVNTATVTYSDIWELSQVAMLRSSQQSQAVLTFKNSLMKSTINFIFSQNTLMKKVIRGLK